MNLKSELKFVIIESPYDLILNDCLPEKIYSKISSLKIRGYLKQHKYGVLPFDGTEEISTHVMLCEILNGEAKPILGFKSISRQKCLRHHTDLPILALLESSKALRQKQVVKNIINSSHDVTYESTCTISPEYNLLDKYNVSAKEIITALTYLYHHERQTQTLISLATPRFKIDQLFRSWGYAPAVYDESEVSPFPYKCLAGEPVQLYIHAGQWGDYPRSLADKYGSLWDSRLHYKTEVRVEKEEDAA